MNKAILAVYGVLGLAALGVAWYVYKKFPAAIADVNKGTAYQDTGIVGTLGHGTDVLSGGTLSQLGTFLGGTAYDWFNPSGSPDTYYGVVFPDGQTHAVHSTDIDKDGYFYSNADSTYYRIKLSGSTRIAVVV
jgi:hypothetical protein